MFLMSFCSICFIKKNKGTYHEDIFGITLHTRENTDRTRSKDTKNNYKQQIDGERERGEGERRERESILAILLFLIIYYFIFPI